MLFHSRWLDNSQYGMTQQANGLLHSILKPPPPIAGHHEMGRPADELYFHWKYSSSAGLPISRWPTFDHYGLCVSDRQYLIERQLALVSVMT